MGEPHLFGRAGYAPGRSTTSVSLDSLDSGGATTNPPAGPESSDAGGTDVWPDVRVRLTGHLRQFVYGVERTPRTAAALMQKAQAWCQKNNKTIGLFQHEAMMTDICSDAVRTVLLPGPKERNLIDLYSDVEAMEAIHDANAAAVSMTGRDRRVGVGWMALTATGLVAGITLAARGHKVGGGAVLGVSTIAAAGLAVGVYGARMRSWWRDAWALPA